MPTGTLLLREAAATSSLAAIVERSQHRKPPLPVYELRLAASHLELLYLKTKPETTTTSAAPADEGFESDVDSLSIVSSDESFTSGVRRLFFIHMVFHFSSKSKFGELSSSFCQIEYLNVSNGFKTW